MFEVCSFKNGYSNLVSINSFLAIWLSIKVSVNSFLANSPILDLITTAHLSLYFKPLASICCFANFLASCSVFTFGIIKKSS